MRIETFRNRALPAAAALAAALCGAVPAVAEEPTAFACALRFRMNDAAASGGVASGSGTVTCADGSSLRVVIRARRAGNLATRSGTGTFSDVHRISEVLGSYAPPESHAQASASGAGQRLTNGKVSLALDSSGETDDARPGLADLAILVR